MIFNHNQAVRVSPEVLELEEMLNRAFAKEPKIFQSITEVLKVTNESSELILPEQEKGYQVIVADSTEHMITNV